MADTLPVLNRRNLAGAALLGLVGVAGGAAPPPGADAELVAIGIEADRLRKQHAALMLEWWAMEVGDPGLNDLASKLDAPNQRLCVLSDRATALPATTLEGMRAKAELVRHFLTIECETDGEMVFTSSDQELTWSLACDMTGGTEA